MARFGGRRRVFRPPSPEFEEIFRRRRRRRGRDAVCFDCDIDSSPRILSRLDQGQLREEEGNEHLPTVLNIPEQELTSRLEQLRRKESEEHRLHEQLRERENHKQKLWQTEEELINCREQLQQKESEKARLHVHSRKIEKEYDYLRKSFEEREAQVTNLQTQLMEKEQQLEYLHQGIANQEKQLRDQEQDMAGLQTALSTAMQKLSEYESQLKTRDWVISRDQIQVNVDKCLGEGGWGRVVEGTYCGCAVAIKYLHKSTLTPQERRVFEREMDIASRCRHPCLLQFIGATKDDKQSPLFVTELMESSLRTLIRQRQLSETHLSETEISVISLDVARALNYLHQRKPTPIVHRDVSSANVLLWRRGDQWRGKVSDYGTAKFVQEIMTVSPGALIYSAPEAGSPFNQTVKIDVYSFGVLLCEMCIGDIPNCDERDNQVAKVKNPEFSSLILWCLNEDPDLRPDMEQVIEKLEQF